MEDVPGYRLDRRIGTGASSAVWVGTQLSTSRRVAVKLLERLPDESAVRRFDRERTVMATLAELPNVVTIIDAGVAHERPWISMQLCRHGSLSGRTLTPAEASVVLGSMAAALEAAHREEILHCDVKPANIMLDDRGAPALTDFGISRRSAARSTTTSTTGYTLDHVPPEILDNARPTAAADVYSLATTVWELLAGRPPFRESPDDGLPVLMRRVLEQPLPAVPDVELPEELADLLTRMTAKDPEARPTMAEVLAETDEIRSTQSWSADTVEVPDLPPEEPEPLPEEPDPAESTTVSSRSEAPTVADVPSVDEAPLGEPIAAEAAWPVQDDGSATILSTRGSAGEPSAPTPAVSEPAGSSRRGKRAGVLVAVALVVLTLGASTAVALTAGAGAAPAIADVAAPATELTTSSEVPVSAETPLGSTADAPVAGSAGVGAVGAAPRSGPIAAAPVAAPPVTTTGGGAPPSSSGGGTTPPNDGQSGQQGQSGDKEQGGSPVKDPVPEPKPEPTPPTRGDRTKSVTLQNPRTASTAMGQWVIGTFAFDAVPTSVSSVCISVEFTGDVLDKGEMIEFAVNDTNFGGHIALQAAKSSVKLCTNGANSSDKKIFGELASSGGVGSVRVSAARDGDSGPASFTVSSMSVTLTALWP